MHLAVREREAPDALREACGERLADAAARIVADEIDPVGAERLGDRGDHGRLIRKSERLIRRDLRVAQPHLVEGHAAAHAGQLLDDVAPLESVQREAVNEDGERA